MIAPITPTRSPPHSWPSWPCFIVMSEELCDSPPQPCVTEARRISIQSTMLHTKRRRSHLEDQSRILSWFFRQLKNSGNYIKWILNLTAKKYLTWLKRKWSWSFFSACHRDAMGQGPWNSAGSAAMTRPSTISSSEHAGSSFAETELTATSACHKR